MRRALLVATAVAITISVVIIVGGGCSASNMTPDEALAALEKKGVRVQAADDRSQIEKELGNLDQAFASGAPIPVVMKRVKLNGVAADVLRCPGRRQQAQLVADVLIRGPRSSDPPHMQISTNVVNGSVNLVFQSLIFSLRPSDEQDAAVLQIAVALARIEAGR